MTASRLHRLTRAELAKAIGEGDITLESALAEVERRQNERYARLLSQIARARLAALATTRR